MPGYELFGAEERKEVNDVLETGIMMRYGFDGPRKGIWKAKELEQAICDKLNVQYTQLASSGTAALTTAMADPAMKSLCPLLPLWPVLSRYFPLELPRYW